MNSAMPQSIERKDYAPPAYLIDTVALHFWLGEEETTVRTRLEVRRNPRDGDHKRPLRLHGRNLELVSIALDGAALPSHRYRVDPEHLTLDTPPASFILELETQIRPQDNTSLEGLYRSSGNFCTQCEAEGFRKITYFLDRPDVMARYTTTINADRERYPVLLSNGNLVDRGAADHGRHWVTWQDPFPKPCYLFALVAGDLAAVEDQFVTRSGRNVALNLYVQRHNIDKCAHAMQALKKAMRWDEATFGLEYDLDTYMIVAVDDFNMGAMENKGLNIFNSKYVLAKPETATDVDYAGIEGVIGHEYFHNWTGNRVTCRDWFQLSLKEGLTMFRDQQFSAAIGSPAIKRIQDVRLLRNLQFAEDEGPMAHPVRPESYIEISNFYTATVYHKGAEVIRMLNTLLGQAGFCRGLTLYLERRDGQAATIEDFLQAMEAANGVDLHQFRLWYSQAGTPTISVKGNYDPTAKVYDLHLEQSCPATPGQPHKEPMHIPLTLGLLDRQGQDLPLTLQGEQNQGPQSRVLHMKKRQEVFRFVGIPEEPTPSLLRGFSAPVKIIAQRADEALAFLLAHDSDAFNRWDAGQELSIRTVLQLVRAHQLGQPLNLQSSFMEALGQVLEDHAIDPALTAETLSLPSETYLGLQMEQIDVDAVHHVRRFLRQRLADAYRERLITIYHAHHKRIPYHFDPVNVGHRALKNLCLHYLIECHDHEVITLCTRQFDEANNMTDALGALRTLADVDRPERNEALRRFHERWYHDPLVMDKWFSIQASSPLPNTLEEVETLTQHPAFDLKNPNRVRALIGTFCHHNPAQFHRGNGDGYRFLARYVLKLDPINPQVAARLVEALSRWRRFDTPRQVLMKAALEEIVAVPTLSKDTYEIASKALT
jgi:aminopeptidase N